MNEINKLEKEIIEWSCQFSIDKSCHNTIRVDVPCDGRIESRLQCPYWIP